MYEPNPESRVSGVDYRVRQLERRPAEGGLAVFHIKVFEDIVPVITGDGAFIFEIPEDMDGAALGQVEAYITTAGTGATLVQIRNVTQAVDMLSTRVGIDTTELNSKDAATQPVVNGANNVVAWGDHIAIDVDSAATGSMGLGVILWFTASATQFFMVQGSQGTVGPAGPTGDTGATGPQGDPGGITAWEGAWTTATGYSVGDAVSHNGASYASRTAHTSGASSEPGVGASWETDWMLLAEAVPATFDITYESRSTNTMLDSDDHGKTIELTAAITQTFDTDDNLGAGWWVILRNNADLAATVVILDPAGTETIDGATSLLMYPGDVRMVISGGAGQNFSSVILNETRRDFDPPGFGKPHDFSGAVDADFNNSLGPWTVVSGASEMVDLYETTTTTARYDLSSQPGWLLIQVGHATTVSMRVDYTLGDGESITIPFFSSGPQAGDNMAVALRLNDDNAGSTSGNYVAIMLEQDTTEWVIQGNDSGNLTGRELVTAAMDAVPQLLLRIDRDGTTYVCWASRGGGSWQYVWRRTGVGTPYDNVWIAVTGPSTGQTYMPVVAIPWTKLGGAGVLPW